jgi:RNA polymerase sigma-70 factor, ECF subfamily
MPDMSSAARPFDSPAAFERLYLHTHLQVFRYIYSLTGGPSAEAEDLTAETYLKAWRNRRSFKGDESFALAWLFRIARNLVIDASRRSKVQEPPEYLEDDISGTGTGLEEDVSQNEQFQAVWKILQSLPLEQREMIVLRYMFSWQVKEIADHLQVTENTVSVYLRRLLIRVRQRFPQD